MHPSPYSEVRVVVEGRRAGGGWVHDRAGGVSQRPLAVPQFAFVRRRAAWAVTGWRTRRCALTTGRTAWRT